MAGPALKVPMSGFQGLQPDPSAIGRLVQPPFAILPDPATLFRDRAARLAVLAEGSDLAPYLGFLAALATVQADLVAALPSATPIPPDQVDQARAGAMPPLNRATLPDDPALRHTIRRFTEAAAAIDMPAEAREALNALRSTDAAALATMIANIALDSIPVEAVAPHLFLSAAVQLHAARLAATLPADRLVPVAPGTCPCCGGPPVSSRVVGWPGAENARYAACAFCGTQWNEVRVKCLACGSTKGIAYRSAETEDAVIKAECCDECRSWVKILYATRNVSLDPVADDVASLGLDLLMNATDYRRAGFNPFLIGY